MIEVKGNKCLFNLLMDSLPGLPESAAFSLDDSKVRTAVSPPAYVPPTLATSSHPVSVHVPSIPPVSSR